VIKELTNLFGSSGASFSECLKYRYNLWRRWTKGPTCVWIMLNPSTADEFQNDPTIERCERRSRNMGYAAVEVVNLFAFRATNPADMMAKADPVGPENDQAILAAISGASLVICAWGNHGAHLGRSRQVKHLIIKSGATPHHLGLTSLGEPRHPLYVDYGVNPTPWRDH
jgi:hypothetical protein